MTENKAELKNTSKFEQGSKIAFNGFGFISIGVLFLLIPVIGWVIGGIMIVLGIIGLINAPVAAVSLVAYEGLCPYCQGNTKVSIDKSLLNTVTGHNCQICQKRFVFRNYHFCSIE